MATRTSLSHVFPLGTGINERGHLENGGCDTIELAREFGTPAYVIAEDDLRARARAFVQAGAACGHPALDVVFASKAFPCTAVLRLLAHEGLWCDVASGGELHLALNAGFPPERILMHGNAKSLAELQMALQARIGLIVIDNFDEIDRLSALLDRAAHAPPGRTVHARSGTPPHAAGSSPAEETQALRQPVLIRVTPDVRGDTHEKISTGQADSKFGFSMREAPAAIERVRSVPGLELEGLHAHIGSQLFDLAPFARAAQALGTLGSFGVWDLGGGLGVAYTADQRPPEIDEYVDAVVKAAHAHGLPRDGRLMIEPGRALSANAGVTLYTVQSVKRNVSTWVAVDGGMSDNLRPMLYGAAYEAHVASRLGAAAADASDSQAGTNASDFQAGDGPIVCVLAGKHCESGDVIVRRALLDDPRAGDVVVTPATGAYGFAMASNYNGVLRPPVVFCKDGDARVVLRRESLDDLTSRDVG